MPKEETAYGEPVKAALRVCIAANFTIEPIEEVLAHWMSELRIPAEIRIAPYNQIFQQLYEGGLLRENRAGLNLIALDLESWLAGPEIPVARCEFEQIVAEFTGAIRRAAVSGARGVVLLFPPNPGISSNRVELLTAATKAICCDCASMRTWTAIDLAHTAALYDVREIRDPFTDALGNIPFTEEMYAAAATAAARWIRAAHSKPRKVIATDCDNTLWQGVCGEGDINVTPAHRYLQNFLLRQQENGVLLAIVSKNNEGDVMDKLQSEQCLLCPDHLTAWRINWQPKSVNLKELSEELGLALNSFVFLDDSPYECSEVSHQLPDVLTIQVPGDAETIPHFLEHLWIFDRGPVTAEDRNRASLYQAERKRTELSRSLTPEQFLATLRIEIEVSPAKTADLPRVAQLTARTTQFNLTGVRHTEQTLSELMSDQRNGCWTVRVRDKFGDYGLVGVLIFRNDYKSIDVDTFLLSCRALGRGVEDRMLADLKALASASGAAAIKIPFIPTARNRPALEFLHRQCSAPLDVTEALQCVLSPSAGSVEWRQFTSHTETAVPSNSRSLPIPSSEEQVTVQITSRMRTAMAILAAARNSPRKRALTDTPFVPPHSTIEKTIARVWSDVLRLHPIGLYDNFYQIGGSSLLAVRILAHIRAELGVELGLTDLLQRPTVASLAELIRASAGQTIPTGGCGKVHSADSASFL